MSRNFELLTQIELDRELEAKSRFPRAEGKRAHPPRVAPGVVPAAVSDDATGAYGEEITRLVQTVFLSPRGRTPHLVVFCGVDGEIGSSSVCADVGRELGANGARSVCLIDANVRTPQLSKIFGLDATNLLAGSVSSVRDQCAPIGNDLWLVGKGALTTDRGTLRSVDGLKQLLAQLHAEFEFVLIDAPGVNLGVDAQLLGQLSDAAVLVLEADSTHRRSARKAKETLDAAGVRLLGSVLRNRTFPIPKALYKRI